MAVAKAVVFGESLSPSLILIVRNLNCTKYRIRTNIGGYNI